MTKHGVFASESATSSIPTAVAAAGVPVVFGTSAIHLSQSLNIPVGVPLLCQSYEEAVASFGYSDDWRSYTLGEFMHAYFKLYEKGPAVFVNVLDPAKHKTHVPNTALMVQAGKATVQDAGIMADSVEIDDGADVLTSGTDYTLSFDASGNLLVAFGQGVATDSLTITYDKLNPAGVTGADIVAALELVEEVYPRFRLLPSLLLAPGWSELPEVGTKMAEKASNINGHFKALAVTDVPTSTVKNFVDVQSWKETYLQTSPHQYPMWPLVTKTGKTYHLSTHAAAAIAMTDETSQGVPYVSPSNKVLKVDGAVLKDGTTVFLGPNQAQTINSVGVATALNFVGGWKLWGNRTAAYPTPGGEPKDVFVSVRRMFDWISNTITLKYWEKLDGPITKRLVESITDDNQLWLNGLTAIGALLGGRIEFNASENPPENLLDGKMVFRVRATPPSPAEEINFVIEYDAQYLSAISGGATA
ncbi:phage tail sheath family protein [Tumebacillus flagellatus]|uniref:Phage tail protein n=1 Tax=Tumebacillus flagellatus TaxID=1157490 RepID=A0A074LXD5_9BACL|nr:phage tail sheath family protein [Tumebacillus flagellatus]KEO84758.1 hypothetical protein EL26_01745 [Tumebacillus flagellatus]